MNFSLLVFLLAFILMSCKKLVEVDPPITNPTSESVYKEDAVAITVLTGLYSDISGGAIFNISRRTGLSGDELSLWSGAVQNDIAYYTNNLASAAIIGATASGSEIWTA